MTTRPAARSFARFAEWSRKNGCSPGGFAASHFGPVVNTAAKSGVAAAGGVSVGACAERAASGRAIAISRAVTVLTEYLVSAAMIPAGVEGSSMIQHLTIAMRMLAKRP